MTPLPIFHFPQLVLIKIINQMTLMEQLLTALCSRKAYALVKNYHIKAIHFVLEIGPGCISFLREQDWRSDWLLKLYIDIESTWISKKEEQSIDINGNRGVRYTIDNRNGKKTLKMCWKDRSVGLKNMLELTCDLFQIVHVDIARIEGPEYMWIFDWFKEQQKTLRHLILQNEIPDDDIKRVILNNTAQRLWMHADSTANLRIQNFPNVFGDLSICSRFQITIDNLIELDCIELQIYDERFTNQEVNRFLKHWVNGGSLRLKYLKIGIQQYIQDSVFADIQNHLTHVPGDRKYTSPYKSTWTFTSNAFQLQRNDGVTASIQYFNGLFLLGVWPDANGNT